MISIKPEKPSALGRSLQLVNGDLAFSNNDLAPIADRDNLVQALQVMIETPIGSDIFNVSYGFDLLNSISAPQSVAFIKDLIRLNIVKSLSLDNRVSEIKEIVFNEIISAEKPEDPITRKRRWEAVITLRTIEDSEVALSLEGRGL